MSVLLFLLGAAAGAMAYRWLYAEKFRKSSLACNEQEKDRQLQKQLERLMTYSGRKEM